LQYWEEEENVIDLNSSIKK